MKRSTAGQRLPRARNAHGRQRQRLIDACISALHVHGPSRTTVEKVVAIANMSPGIVRFYFDSKAAMLVASLQFLASEFEERVLVPVAKLKARPVAALELMVDLYLDPDIASPRKVSVWYAFWGEASSRQEYYDICGQKDESFAALIRELVGRLIVESAQPHLDPDGVALGLIGALEILWQDFAFRNEEDIDRQAARARCMAYLRSIFPRQFAPLPMLADGQTDAVAAEAPLGAWVYDNARAFALERELVFRTAWQFVGHEAQIPAAGDFLTEAGTERVLVVRDGDALHALRNSCPELPHTLVAMSRGRFGGVIECPLHGLKFDLTGAPMGAGGPRLDALEVQRFGGLIFVRSRAGGSAAALSLERWFGRPLPPGLMPLARWRDIDVAADWKVVVEQWLESAVTEDRPDKAAACGASPDIPSARDAADFIEWSVDPVRDAGNWSARHLRRAAAGADTTWRRRFVAPNHLIESRPDGVSIVQVVPIAPGRCVLRRHEFTRLAPTHHARTLQYLARRLSPYANRAACRLAESTQEGMIVFGYRAGVIEAAPAVAWFRRHVSARVPVLRQYLPPPGI